EKNGPTDDRLFLILFERDDGRRALYWSFACHAVTLSFENRLVSADYPGVVARELEGASFDLVAYAAGGVGSSNPRRERRATSLWLTAPLVRALKKGVETAAAHADAEGALASLAIE